MNPVRHSAHSPDTSPSSTMVMVDRLRFSYDRTTVLNDISLQVQPGQIVGILGPNGSGKSTLLKLIGGILTPTPNHVFFKGKDICHQNKKSLAASMCWIPQDHHMAFAFKVAEVVMMGRHPYLSPFSFETPEDNRIVVDAMKRTDVLAFANRSFNEISGGEKQRVLLASALAQQPELMLLDEPTSALDLKYQVEILHILQKLNRDTGITLLLAMHDLQLASKICHRLVFLKEGHICAEGSPDEMIQKDILEKVYGVPVRVLKDKGFFISPEMPQ